MFLASRRYSSSAARHARKHDGFTLVELVVSVGILTVISAIVLVNHARFSGDILLGNLAYDIALSFRQAQVYGLSVRESGVGTGAFGQGYGIHLGNDTNTSYLMFIDDNDNESYDGASELLEAFTLQRGNIIQDFCASTAAGVEKCRAAGDITKLDILFQRPDPDAVIKSDIGSDIYERARITIQSPQGSTREVSIVSTGQISVEQQGQ